MPDRYREFNRFGYLSTFERRLNRFLWAVLWIGLIYSIFQHLFLAAIPEAFPTGARWGDLAYDLAIAYIGAFTFYLLVVRLPLRRDRRNVYRHLGPLINRAVGEALSLMRDLNGAAEVEQFRQNT